MNYLHSDLGFLDAGALVTVTLRGNAANVLLLDAVNLSRYRTQSRYEYFGGHFDRSPAQIAVPRAGNWHVVVDLGGAAGRVDASIEVLSLGQAA
jgi:hypothetical protein